jgi:hypothetical protein
MSIYGIDEETEKETAEQNVLQIEEVKKRRKPFAIWTVGGREYNLKLKTVKICQLEEKFKSNLLNVLTGNGVPPLAIMLTVVQAAMQEWEHGVKFADVQNMFDKYCDEGGTQITLFTDVIMPVMTVSGFFTEEQTKDMEERMQEAKELM